MIINERKDYYLILGVDENAKTRDIISAYRTWIKKNWEMKSTEERKKNQKDYSEIIEAYNVLKDEKIREIYDKKRAEFIDEYETDIAKKITKNINKIIDEEFNNNNKLNANKKKIINEEEIDNELENNPYKKGNSWIKIATIALISIMIIAGTHISTTFKNNKPNKNTNPIIPPSSQEESIAQKEEKIINDEQKLYEKINLIKKINTNYAPSFQNENDVLNLLMWTHKKTNKYNNECSITNEFAYTLLKELMNNNSKFDISLLYENVDGYENIKKLNSALTNIDSKNSTLKDEYEAYQAINDIINTTINQKNTPEIVAYISLIDYYINENNPSMVIACGIKEGSGFNLKDTTKDYLSGNKDYEKLQNTLTKEQQEECLKIYELINYNSENYIFIEGLEIINNEDNNFNKQRQ